MITNHRKTTIEATEIFVLETIVSELALVHDERQSNQWIPVEIAHRQASYRRQIS